MRSISRITEAFDLEMVSAAAPGAPLTHVVTAIKNGGAFSPAQYIIDRETAPIMSMSYQECELFEGKAGNAQIKALWQQGATDKAWRFFPQTKIIVVIARGCSHIGGAQCDLGRDVVGQPGRDWPCRAG